jgi:hypothetical protein
MDKKIAGLLGAAAALGSFTAAQAAPPVANPAPAEILSANSFADLLEPIPNAVTLLQIVDEAGPIPTANENIQQVQYYYHHHHHHHAYRPAPRIIVVPPRYRYHHHHHHHHHHSYYRRDY